MTIVSFRRQCVYIRNTDSRVSTAKLFAIHCANTLSSRKLEQVWQLKFVHTPRLFILAEVNNTQTQMIRDTSS